MNKTMNIFSPLALVAVVVAVWWIAVVQTGSIIFPTPLDVIVGTLELVRLGTLWDHIASSLMRVGAGYLLAATLAIPLGLLMGWFKGFFVTLNPLIQILRPISPIAWIPLAILWRRISAYRVSRSFARL
jgi:NitT/TauT family transport system permease protein